MKKFINSIFWMLCAIVALTSCSAEDGDTGHSLGNIASITASQITFSQTPSPTSANVITFANTTKINGVYSVKWDLGNGTTGNTSSITGQYPLAGSYNVTLTITTADGVSASKTEVLTLSTNDYNLISTPNYVHLTGSQTTEKSRTWVLDQYNNYAARIANATGLAISGHEGLGPEGSYGQSWWAAKADEKNTWTLYAHKFTFSLDGLKVHIANQGTGYGRKACATAGGFAVSSTSGDDCLFSYSGGDYTFSPLNETGKYPSFTLSGNAFLGYYCGSQKYEILYLDDECMALRVDDTIEGQDWVFVYCRDDLNVATPKIVKKPQEVPLSENFESGTLTVPFVSQDMGARTGITDNIAPSDPNNTSSKVFRYQKSTSFYSNIYFVAPTYKFDLSKQNKITLKVFIPSFNDYTSDWTVAGDWITNKKLQNKVAVKLQNTDDGDNAWQTQTEIDKTDIPFNTWVTLTFDFSNVAQNANYDKIVIQLGGEGHAGQGIFYLDDFSFSE